jgi:hypothetical protein
VFFIPFSQILTTEHSQTLLSSRSFSVHEKVKKESEITHVSSVQQLFLDSNETVTSRNSLLLMQMMRLVTQRACRHFLYVITKCCFKLFWGGVELCLRSR